MARLEDMAESANSSFCKTYGPSLNELGYKLTSKVSRVGAVDRAAPRKSRDLPCIVATIELMGNMSHPLSKGELKARVESMIEDRYEGVRVFIQYR